MKIKKIEVQNYKAIENQEIDFSGSSAIITAGNDKGKTSLLRGLVDRFKSEKPDVIVKEGKEKGYNIIELTDGSRIEWKFTEKSESFAFITPDGIKQTTGVISAIGERYFGMRFNIDSFLNSTPKEQQKQMEKIVGLDFSEIDEEYREAYEERTEKNRELRNIANKKMEEPEEVDKPDVESIREEIKIARSKNEKIRENKNKVEHLEQIQANVSGLIDETEFEGLFDYGKSSEIINKFRTDEKPQDVEELENKLAEANEQMRKYDSYERDLKEYEEWVKEGAKARKEAEKADKKVKEIQAKKEEMIANAEMPEGFEFDENGLIYNGFPLTENQISSSAKYISALKLGYMVLGEVKTLHFDASFLDNKSLDEVMKWAESKDLQLLIERPDMSGGEIKYELIEK